MKGLIRGAAGLVAVLAFSGCGTDQTIDLMGPPTGIQATPASAFTATGDSTAILLRMVNDRNQAVPTKFEISNVGAAITVAYDAKYRPDYTTGDTLGAPEIKTQQRYFAKGAAPGKATFTVTSGSLSTTVTIVVQPKNLGPALNKTSGVVAGDTVTITAPSGLKFTPASAVTFASGAIAIASRAADSSNIKVVMGPGAGGVATVTGVIQDYAPTLASKSLATTNSLALTPAVTVVPTTVSTAAPAFGATMTVTLGGGLRLTATSTITVGGRTAYILSKSADSATATIVPFGGSNGNVAYTNVVLSFLNTVNLAALPGDKTVTVGPVTNDPNALLKATASTVTLPAVGQTLVFSDGSPYPNNPGCAGAGGGDGCRWYKFVLAAPLKVDMELKWDPGVSADMGIYSEIGGGLFFIDAFGHDAGQTETKANITIPAGTTYWVNTYYAPGQPTFFHLKITGKP
jgi:hypothetical protein